MALTSAEKQRRYRERHREESSARRRAWYQANREQVLSRMAEIRHADPTINRVRALAYKRAKLGVTQEEADALLALQDGTCSICGSDGAGRTLHLDHDHDTGAVRKFLCSRCNQAIGLLGDDPDRVLSAYIYVLTAREAPRGE